MMKPLFSILFCFALVIATGCNSETQTGELQMNTGDQLVTYNVSGMT